MKNVVDIMKAFSDETRLRIMNLLYDRELCVCDIMETLKITQVKASRHLISLKNAGLVKDRKHAQWAYYSIASDLEMKLIDSVVFDVLRKLELYQKDLENLNVFLSEKKIKCK